MPACKVWESHIPSIIRFSIPSGGMGNRIVRSGLGTVQLFPKAISSQTPAPSPVPAISPAYMPQWDLAGDSQSR